MSETMTITTTQEQEAVPVTVFHLAGNLDASNENELCEQAQRAFESGVKNLVLDLERVDMISSAGLRALHNIFRMCTTEKDIEEARKKDEPYKSPHFKLAAASSQVYYVLNLAGFLHNIPIYSSLQEALDSYAA